jgi:hypothetical protein
VNHGGRRVGSRLRVAAVRRAASASLAEHDNVVKMAGSSQDALKAGPRKLVFSQGQSRRRPRVLSPILTKNAGHQVEAAIVEFRDDGDPIDIQDSHHFAKNGHRVIEVMQNVHYRDAAEVPVRIVEMRGIAANEMDALLQASFRAQQAG